MRSSRSAPNLVHVRVQGPPDGLPAVNYHRERPRSRSRGSQKQTTPPPSTTCYQHPTSSTGSSCPPAVLTTLCDHDPRGPGRLRRARARRTSRSPGSRTSARCQKAGERGRDRPRHGDRVYGSVGVDFACSDGQRVMVVALTPGQWTALTSVRDEGACSPRSDRPSAPTSGRSRSAPRCATRSPPSSRRRSSARLDGIAEELDAARVLWSRYQRDDRSRHRPPRRRAPGLADLALPAAPPAAAPTPRSVGTAARGGGAARRCARHRRGARQRARARRGRDREPARQRGHRLAPGGHDRRVSCL